MLDLKKVKEEASLDNEPVEVVLHDRDDNPYDGDKPATFFVLGEYSDKIREYDRAQTNKNLKKAGRGKPDDLTAEKFDAGIIERLATAVVGWKNIVSDGVAVEYSHEGVLTILREMPWNRNRVSDGMVQHSRFFPKRSAG